MWATAPDMLARSRRRRSDEPPDAAGLLCRPWELGVRLKRTTGLGAALSEAC
jgi:hypothetical protein